jgi:hypothetical protein
LKNNLGEKLKSVGTIFLLVFCITSFFGGWTSSKVLAAESTLEIQENETGFVEVDGSIESEHSSYTGNGYANTLNYLGSYIEWVINVPSAGSYELQWRFANGGSANRAAEVLINDSKQISDIDFSATGGWSSWSTTSLVSVNLQAGDNSIRLVAKTDDGLANIDWIEITGNQPSAGNGDQASIELEEGDILLAPNDSMTLQEAIESIQAGNTIYLEDGTYALSQTVVIAEGNDGASGARKKIVAYNNATPVLDFSAMAEDSSNRGIVLSGDYWHIKGVIIQNAGDNGMLLAGNNNIIEECVFRYNRDSGLQVSRINSNYDDISEWPSNNLILNSESHDNADSDHEDADGFAPKLTVGEGNIFRGCVSHHNIDDGWDLYAKSATGPIGVVTIEDCIAHDNGLLSDGNTSGSGDKNGFKLGSSGIYVDHIVRRSIAFNNGKHGFTDNGNTGSIKFINNTAYNNGDYNFHTRDGASHVFINNISFAGGHTDRIVGDTSAPNALTEDDIYWYYTADESDFITLTPGMDSDPTSNGFLHLKSGSDLIDVGVLADGIEYNGSAPDLGAIESD